MGRTDLCVCVSTLKHVDRILRNLARTFTIRGNPNAFTFSFNKNSNNNMAEARNIECRATWPPFTSGYCHCICNEITKMRKNC
jgi:hypothetical protein